MKRRENKMPKQCVAEPWNPVSPAKVIFDVIHSCQKITFSIVLPLCPNLVRALLFCFAKWKDDCL